MSVVDSETVHIVIGKMAGTAKVPDIGMAIGIETVGTGMQLRNLIAGMIVGGAGYLRRDWIRMRHRQASMAVAMPRRRRRQQKDTDNYWAHA
jgi:hypothetical protein